MTNNNTYNNVESKPYIPGQQLDTGSTNTRVTNEFRHFFFQVTRSAVVVEVAIRVVGKHVWPHKKVSTFIFLVHD